MIRYIPAKEVKEGHQMRIKMPGIYQESCRVLKKYHNIDAEGMDITDLRNVNRLIEVVIFQRQWGNPQMILEGND
mgnify:CR=1 FL=1